MAGAYIRKRERKDGVAYMAAVDLGKDPITGKRRERSETFATRWEAKAALARMQAEIDKGTFVGRSTQMVGDLLSYWMETHVEHNCRETTALRYRQTVFLHLVPGLGNIPLQKLTPARVQAFYADKLSSGTGIRSVVFCHQRLRQALAMAVRLGLIGRNTVATLAIGAGQDIRTLADLLGHSKTSVTTDIYAHVLPHRKRELTQALSQIILGGNGDAE